jgi:hypothetical protein
LVQRLVPSQERPEFHSEPVHKKNRAFSSV